MSRRTGIAFASATRHFSTERPPVQEEGGLLSLSRRYFRVEGAGDSARLRPIEDGVLLSPGDEIEVHLAIGANHPCEYVHLRDPRAAGLEPGVTVSGHRYQPGIAWYQETRDSATNFFIESLPRGEFTLTYRLRAQMAGAFRVGPATLQSMYAQEFTAYSAGAVVRIGTGDPSRGQTSAVTRKDTKVTAGQSRK